MRIIPRFKIHHYVARVSVFLTTVALIVGMVGCGPFLLQYSLTISSTEGGEVTTPGEGTFTYFAGTVVGLMAEAEEGYYFVEWTGDIATTACQCHSTTITMSGDYSITANFAFTTEMIEIWDWYDLDAVRDSLIGNHTLMNDLDSTTPGYEELASGTANQGAGWQPIGTEHDWFTGTFDGQGHEIRDLFINRPGEDLVGLFGYVDEEGVIANIGVVNATVTGNLGVGCLVGDTVGNVTNCYATGTVTGGQWVGGLMGANGGDVGNSHFNGSATGTGTGEAWGSTVGGLVGFNGGGTGTVNNSYSTGSVTGYGHSAGGLVGGSAGATVAESYSTSSVTGYGHGVGGLVGASIGGNVTDCYATGDVTGTSYVGGLAGGNGYQSTVRRSYSTGSVTGSELVGGLVGDNSGNVTNSFWDTETSGQATSGGGTGKTTAEMQDIHTFSGAGWDIIGIVDPGTRNLSYVWNIVNNVTYPFLSWQS